MKYLLFIATIFLLTLKVQAQNVGIGTTAPVARLHVADSSVLFSAPNDIPASPGGPPVSGMGRRMMWYPEKAAFRVGFVGNQWDKDSIGNYSFATGYVTKAKGISSAAMGRFRNASGFVSTAMGANTSANGDYSSAMGYSTTASGGFSMAMGSSTTASGESSTGMGYSTTASGNYSTAMGYGTKSKAMASFATGILNDVSDNPSQTLSESTDRIFQIGNGAFPSTFSNAVTVLRNGNTGIGTVSPLARLHVADSSVVFSATGLALQNPGDPPISGPGRRMMWYPDKAAFRAGYADAENWDKANVGKYSIGLGTTIASGEFSVATGYYTTASNDATTAMGNLSIASGNSSTAIGTVANASGNSSTAMGFYTTASGYYSTAMGESTFAIGVSSTSTGSNTAAGGNFSFTSGQNTVAKAMGSFSSGLNNDDSDTPNPTTTASTDRIFQIGNGEQSTYSNAITILRNGNTGIGTVNPHALLQFGNTVSNRKIVLWEGTDNDHQFYGFGINGSTLRYQTPSPGDAHVFYSGVNTTSSSELFRINGNGNVGVGVNAPAFRLDVGDRMRIRSTPGNSAGVWLNSDDNITSPAFIGMKANDEVGFYGQTGTAGWRFYVNTTTGNGWMQGTLTQNSDMRLKKDISLLQNSLQKITQLNGYTYHWKNENTDSRLQTGVLAQEVQKLFPELVTENKEGILAVNYSGLIPVMIESIKEQQMQIEKLIQLNSIHQKQIDKLKKLIQQK